MIIKKGTKHPITRSDEPYVNWTGEDDYIVIDDHSKLGQKILKHAPYFDWVYEGEEIVDITPTERPPEPPPEPTEIEVLQQENALLKAQNQALVDKTDFHEDVLEEIILTTHS